MISSTWKRLIALALACLLTAGGAAAEKAVVMSKATVYETANQSSKVLGSVSMGTTLELVAERGGWAKVTMNGHTGFMSSDAVSALKEYGGAAGYATEATPMYAAFSTSSKKLGTVPSGGKVSVLETAGSWARVTYEGHTGFVALSKLSKEAPKAQEPITAYVKADNSKVYNASGKVIATVDANTEVRVKAVKGDVCQVERGGITAYMYQSELSKSKVEQSVTRYANKDGAKVYNASGKVIGTLDLNAEVKLIATSGDKGQVRRGDNTGIMYLRDLSEKQTGDGVTEIKPTAYYVKEDGAKVYSSDKKVIATLNKGAAVTVNAYNDTLARVVNGSATGFMYKTDLSAEKPETFYELKYGDTGEAVERLQNRLKELGYFSGSTAGNYLDITKSAVSGFQKEAGLSVTGIADAATLKALFADDAPKKKVEEVPGSSATPATGTAKEMDWWTSGIQTIFARGTTATVTDVATGIAWHVTRSGGSNHADVQPSTAADTAAMKKAVGSWSWTRRAIFVTINGVNYAASMNCMPHGTGSITTNDFNGHHCIHFTNSRTHGSNKVCPLHQAAIKKAAAATL